MSNNFSGLEHPLVDLTVLRTLTIKPEADYKEEDMVAVRELMTIVKTLYITYIVLLEKYRSRCVLDSRSTLLYIYTDWYV